MISKVLFILNVINLFNIPTFSHICNINGGSKWYSFLFCFVLFLPMKSSKTSTKPWIVVAWHMGNTQNCYMLELEGTLGILIPKSENQWQSRPQFQTSSSLPPYFHQLPLSAGACIVSWALFVSEQQITGRCAKSLMHWVLDHLSSGPLPVLPSFTPLARIPLASCPSRQPSGCHHRFFKIHSI